MFRRKKTDKKESPQKNQDSGSASEPRKSVGGRGNLVKDNNESSPVRIEDVYDGVPGFGSKGNAVGQGGTASVYKIVHKKTGTPYALKVLNLMRVSDKAKREMLLREIPIMKSLDHPNVIKIVEVFRKLNTVYIVMELCSGGELFDKLYDQEGCRFDEAETRHLVTKMLQALRYLHANNLVHRDLKLENFIFTSKSIDADIKLIDFGFSKEYLEGDTKMNELVGTCYYVAPEVLGRSYTNASDLWSLGVIVFMMVTGEAPFDGNTNSSIMSNIKSRSQNPKALQAELAEDLAGCSLSEGCIDFVLKLLTVDPKKRINAEAALKHPWIATEKYLSKSSKKRPLKTDSAQTRESRITIDQMVANAKQNALQKSALFAVAFEMNSTELTELNETFKSMDHNHDGAISFQEFKDTMSKHGQMKSSEQMQEIFRKIDIDGTGTIQYSEFLASALEQKQFLTQEAIEAAFYRLDLDSSGYLSRDELKAMLGGQYDDEALKKVLDGADLDGDGKISLEEFKAVISGGTVGKPLRTDYL
eukprot:m.45877 g.45877  ORF g.45877 m.45877 type:complete len:531 (+) comp10305_c0_seq1:89-1681(+)